MLAAVVLHLLAMLGTTQIVAKALCRATASRGAYALGPAWPLALALTGALLWLMR